ncbi:unnamed protein product, partial [Pelagomonas calceolata]
FRLFIRPPEPLDGHAGHLGELDADRVVAVVVDVVHLPDARRDERLEAVHAGVVRDVGAAAAERDAHARGVRDGVLLGVHRGLLVAVRHDGLVRRALEEAVVAHAEHAPVAHDDAADVQALAGRARGREQRHAAEVLVPRHALVAGRLLRQRLDAAEEAGGPRRLGGDARALGRRRLRPGHLGGSRCHRRAALLGRHCCTNTLQGAL